MPVLLSRMHGFLPAAAALLVAIALHYAMISAFGQDFSGIFFVYLAAMLIGGWCGYLPGICVVLAVVAGIPFLFRPDFSLAEVKLDGLAVLLLVSLMVSRTAATHRRIEQLLRGMNDELSRRVHEQTLQLEQANSALRRQLAEIETFYEKSSTGLCVLDHELRVLRVNDKLAALTGMPVAAHMGKSLRELLPAPLVASVEPLCRGVLESGSPLMDQEIEGLLPGTRERKAWLLGCSPIVVGQDGVAGLQIILQDISERIRIERERMTLLEREKAARADADAANHAKDEFLAILGHELRNPLSAMTNGAALLRSNPSPERRAWIEQMMDRQVQQLQRLVADLLEVTRVTRGKIELQKSRLNLAVVLNQAVEANKELFDERKQRLSVSFPPGMVLVDGDAARIEQIVSNLLSNAAKYTPPGGEVALSVEKADSDAIIRCRDTGIGMSSDVLSRIFEPFVQVDSSPERTGSGLGMGLTLVKKLAELHGGTVVATSAGLGRGSQFTVRLPLAAEDGVAAPEAPEPAVPQGPLQTRKILLIEDNRELAMVTAELLRDRGQDVQLAFSGQEGMARAREFRPEVILCDLNLPDATGFEVAKSLREDQSLSPFLLVGVTAGYVEGYEAAKTGFDRFLTKPLVWAKLSGLLMS